MSVINCPKCNSSRNSCTIKEDGCEEYKSRMECDSCGYYMRWNRYVSTRTLAEYDAEEEWNNKSAHLFNLKQ